MTSRRAPWDRVKQRFLMMKAEGSDTTGAPLQIVVVQHFDEELRRLVPTK